MKISIWTGKAFESWGPSSDGQGGIGGSETAAIHMAENLADLGHEVKMFGEHQGNEGIVAGYDLRVHPGSVEYIHYERALAKLDLMACDVFVSSRDKSILRLSFPRQTTVLWVHDIHVGDDWYNEVDTFDRVYCLTRWHRGFFLEQYQHADETKVAITRNGIDPSRFEPSLPWEELKRRKCPRFVWSSSLDRGLDVMLDLWPKIRKMEPRAELHVYYGVENWRKLNAENAIGLKVVDYMMTRIASMKGDDVAYHGRVGQVELAQAHMGALVWAYPTAWLETSCITALEAQAAGCIPVASDLAALPETIHTGFLVPGRNKSPEYRGIFLAYLEEALLRKTPAFDHRGIMDFDLSSRGNREWALARTWASIALEWEADFKRLLGTAHEK
jgi:glycosyltransferase involved in cell wall biosynthesis